MRADASLQQDSENANGYIIAKPHGRESRALLANSSHQTNMRFLNARLDGSVMSVVQIHIDCDSRHPCECRGGLSSASTASQVSNAWDEGLLLRQPSCKFHV